MQLELPDDRIIFTSIDGPWNGIRFDFSDGVPPTPSNLHYCDISNSKKYGTNCGSPDPESSGGAIYIRSFSDLEIRECDIFENVAMGHGGAIAVFDNSNPLIEKNAIHINYAGHKGGGLSIINASSPSIKGNRLYENESDKGGGAIFVGTVGGSSCSPNIIGNVISKNSTNGVNNTHGEGGAIFICNSKSKLIDNTIDNNNPNPIPGFISSTDYHLSSASPCINVGFNSVPMTTIDLDGFQRIMNGTTDYGCYEFGSTPPARRSDPNSLVANDDITIYPNPATDFLIINTASEQNVDISIYSMSGQRVYLSESCLISGEKIISISDIKQGVYIIKLQTQNTSINKRIIIQ
ncbi:MAG: hypothetical protein B6I18_03560 [Bacteroidetes bacterium 4572_112]|nr:MAG: hypothetical protein B6I18_03560 [Bacteroidetes bacterium 4572_112]